MSLRIPELALPLLTAPHCVVIATNMPDGTPHQSIVWHLWEDPHILISSYGATQKVKNLRRDPRVSITVFAPHDPYNYVVVRGVVQSIEPELDDLASEEAFVNRVSRHYTGKKYYGNEGEEVHALVKDAMPNTLVITIQPTKISYVKG